MTAVGHNLQTAKQLPCGSDAKIMTSEHRKATPNQKNEDQTLKRKSTNECHFLGLVRAVDTSLYSRVPSDVVSLADSSGIELRFGVCPGPLSICGSKLFEHFPEIG